MRNTSLIFLALLILTLTTACGIQNEESKQSQAIDSDLRPYLDKFVSYGSQNGVGLNTSSLTMTFSESMPASSNGGTVIGYCQRTLKGPNVVIRTSYWNTASVSNREQLVFHELGHCLLGLSHNDSTESAPVWGAPSMIANGVPSSIMNTFHFGSTLYSGNRNEYVNRLFRGASVQLYWNAPSQIGANEY